MSPRAIIKIFCVLLVLSFLTAPGFGATRHRSKHARLSKTSLRKGRHTPVSHLSRLHRKRYIFNPWTEPTFADSTVGDLVDGEDLVVRRAAVQALGPYNGTVVVTDPRTGRLLSIVNQNLALKSGYEPCSTIKLVSAIAGLNEGVIDRDTTLRVGRRRSFDLTTALAKSNNTFFAQIGYRLGFQKISNYARLMGLGEKATLDIAEEQPGTLPTSTPSEGMGMMCSFGSGIRITPLQLAAMVSSLANGGTLYYLQHPRTQEQVDQFVPRVKRKLDIGQWIPDLKPGMTGAVEYGTARRAGYAATDQSILGKTGTCTDTRQPGVHLGWFCSYNDVGPNKLVVVVLLTGGRPINGPVASGVAGSVYRNLSEQNYFGQGRTISPVALISQ